MSGRVRLALVLAAATSLLAGCARKTAEPAAPAVPAAPPPARVAPAPMASGHAPETASEASPQTARDEMAAQHGVAAAGPDVAPPARVEKATGKNARTVAELWKERAALKGREIAVRGTVVKVTPGVLGKNWLHLRDGSGSRAAKDDDLTVTTDAVAKVGDVVTATGLVSIDKDFGAGYAYPVILENARVK